MSNLNPNTFLATNTLNNPASFNFPAQIQFKYSQGGPYILFPIPIGINYNIGYGPTDTTYFYNGLPDADLSASYTEDVYIVARNVTSLPPYQTNIDIRKANTASELVQIANSNLFSGQPAYTSVSDAVNGMLDNNIVIMPYNLPNFSTNNQNYPFAPNFGQAGQVGIVFGFIAGFTSCLSKLMTDPTIIRCFTSGQNNATTSNINLAKQNLDPIVLANGYDAIQLLNDGTYLELNKTNQMPYGSGAFSFNCWFNSTNVSNTQILASWGNIQLQISDNGFQIIIGGNTIINETGILSNNNWYNLFVTYNQGEEKLNYEIFSVSGSILSGFTIITLNNPSQNFYLSDVNNTNNFVGYVKSCIFYQFQLSQAQINSDYANMLPLVQ
jgi:hypothetical protein